jgi:TRAP transporter 4TM/12TM fusion protein
MSDAPDRRPETAPGVTPETGDSARPWGWQRDRRLSGPAWFATLGLSTLGLLISVNQIFNLQAFGFAPISTAYYYLLIGLFLPIVFLNFPARAADMNRVRWYDWPLAAAALGVGLYLAANARNIIGMGWDILAPPVPTAVAGALVLLALEGVRRCGGTALLVICSVFAVYPLFAGHMPGFLWGSQYTLEETARAHAMGVESIIGIPMRVVSDLLIGFLVFGVALTVSGGGDFFMRLATALLGGSRGGPAKVAILSSGFFGSLSGSVISNVLSTGSMTIPTMKRCGYPPAYAGAVESCASTGGALMPPVMGAVAFIMASFLNVPYVEVMTAAAVPAILFYTVLLLQADAYAARVGLMGLPRGELPPLLGTLRDGWVYLFSLALLVYLLLVENIESMAPFWAAAVLMLTALVLRRGAERLRVLLDFLIDAGVNVAHLIGILAGIGLIVGALSITGVGNAFSRELVQYAGDSLILLLILGAATSFVLGMGMTVSACYIFLAIVLAPALVQSGLNTMASHLFILYWGMLSYITPPVALAAVAAAGIAKAPAMATGLKAMRLGLVLFLLPFMFVYNPALILHGGLGEIALSVTTALAAVWILSSAFERYLYFAGPLKLWQCGVLLAGALALMVPEHRTDLLGAAALALVYGERLLLGRRRAAL